MENKTLINLKKMDVCMRKLIILLVILLSILFPILFCDDHHKHDLPWKI